MSGFEEFLPSSGFEVSARRTIRQPTDSDVSAILVRSGVICLFRFSDQGLLRILALRYPGELIIPQELTSGTGIQALVPSFISRQNSSDFFAMMHADDAFSRLVQKHLVLHYQIAMEWVMRSTYSSVGKIAHILCETAARTRQRTSPEHPFDLNFTQEQVASIAGQTAVNVNRVMKEWQRQGLIAGNRHRMIVNWTEMERLGRFDASYLI